MMTNDVPHVLDSLEDLVDRGQAQIDEARAEQARIDAIVAKAPRMAGLRNPRVKASLALQAENLSTMAGLDTDHVTDEDAARLAVGMYDILDAVIGPQWSRWIESVAEDDQFPVMTALFGKVTDLLGKGLLSHI